MNTKFADWIRNYGVSRLAHDCEVTWKAAKNWQSGRAYPRVDLAHKILSLSHNTLTLDDIYQRHTNG